MEHYVFQRICPFHLSYWSCGLYTELPYHNLRIHREGNNIFLYICNTNNLWTFSFFLLLQLEIYQFYWSLQNISFFNWLIFSINFLFSIIMPSTMIIFNYLPVILKCNVLLLFLFSVWYSLSQEYIDGWFWILLLLW